MKSPVKDWTALFFFFLNAENDVTVLYYHSMLPESGELVPAKGSYQIDLPPGCMNTESRHFITGGDRIFRCRPHYDCIFPR